MEFPLQFICASHDFASFEKEVAAPALRKSFLLEEKPQKAQLLICGLGFYELYINGTNITKGLLAPYISNPSHLLYYDMYEVAAHLQQGENVIGVVLGNGMQNCFGGYVWEFDKADWRGAPRVALSLTVEDKPCLQADQSFVTHDSPTYFNDLRCGEYYDARKEQNGWCSAGFLAENWQPAQLAQRPTGQPTLCTAEPIVLAKKIKAVSITPIQQGYLYDFGENSAGVPCLQITGTAGQEIILEHGELLKEDGSLDLQNIQFVPQGYVQRDKYTCKGEGQECFVPRFTYHGFQYIFVSGITKAQAVEGLLTYHVMHSDLQEKGSFACSDQTASLLQILTRRSTLANFYYFPTDCPHREKNGWTGDAALSAEHMLLNLSVENSFAVWLQSIRKAQNQAGALPGIVPTGDWGFDWGNGPAWDSVLTYLPYYTYRYRGDKQILVDNATAIFRYLHFISGKRDAKGLLHIGLGDWCPPTRGAGDYVAPLELTDSIISLDICRKAQQIFAVLGMALEQEYAQKLGDALLGSIRQNLIDFDTMTAAGACQTAQAMALYFGVFLPSEKQAATARLLTFIAQKDGHFDTGILGARVIFHVLSKAGYSDLAFDMIVRQDFPSYGNWIQRGATSLGEAFFSQDQSPASLNHHFFGDISAWFIKRVAGICINPSFVTPNELVLQPHFITALTHARAHHQCPFGAVESQWTKVEQGKIEWQVTVPEAMQGKLIACMGWKFADELNEKPAQSGTYILVKRK